MMRTLLGLEAVLADGTGSPPSRLIKNNAGYDLKQWFVAEDTLVDPSGAPLPGGIE